MIRMNGEVRTGVLLGGVWIRDVICGGPSCGGLWAVGNDCLMCDV